jgi:hypothetical protein
MKMPLEKPHLQNGETVSSPGLEAGISSIIACMMTVDKSYPFGD